MASYEYDTDDRGRPIRGPPAGTGYGVGMSSVSHPSFNSKSIQCTNCGGDHRASDCHTESKDYGRHSYRGNGGGFKDYKTAQHCYNCGGEGHKSYECTEPRDDYRSSDYRGERRDRQPIRERRGSGSGSGYSFNQTRCFNCEGTGHMSYECPEPRHEQSGTGHHRSSRRDSASSSSVHRADRRDSIDSELDHLEIGDPARPRLHLTPRSTPLTSNGAAQQTPTLSDAYAKKASNPFGDAKPREFNLLAAGKSIDPSSPPPSRRSSIDSSSADVSTKH